MNINIDEKTGNITITCTALTFADLRRLMLKFSNEIHLTFRPYEAER